jgi:hypothetical protein
MAICRIRNTHLRHSLIGLLTAFPGGVSLIDTLIHGLLVVVLDALDGVAYVLAFRLSRQVYPDSAMTAAALGVPLWTFLSVIVFSQHSGRTPKWIAEEMRALFPKLVCWE